MNHPIPHLQDRVQSLQIRLGTTHVGKLPVRSLNSRDHVGAGDCTGQSVSVGVRKTSYKIFFSLVALLPEVIDT